MRLDFKTRLLIYLAAKEGATPYEIGNHFWPHLVGRGSSHGGPSSCAVAASWQCGRIERLTRFIERGYKTRKWALTEAGWRFLREQAATIDDEVSRVRKATAKVSETQLRILSNLAAGKPGTTGFYGRSEYGGAEKAKAALARRGLTSKGEITKEGKEALYGSGLESLWGSAAGRLPVER